MFWRSAWKYRARCYRYCFWDTGTMLANLLAAAAADEIPAEIVTAFVDEEVEALVGIDGKHEGVTALVALGGGSSKAPEPPALPPFPFESIPLSPRETAYDELVKIHRESSLVTPDEVRAIADAPPLASPRSGGGQKIQRFDSIAPADSLGLGETVLRRGATRTFAHESIYAEELDAIIRSSDHHPRADFPSLTETYLIVNAVHEMEPGAYYYDRDQGAFEMVKAGTFRAEAGYLCLEQTLGADCSALVVYMSDLERGLAALGNRAYRDVHLEAGLLGGRAWLAAFALGHGATGLTFYDDDTTKFFTPHAENKSPILMVAIGVPQSKASPA